MLNDANYADTTTLKQINDIFLLIDNQPLAQQLAVLTSAMLCLVLAASGNDWELAGGMVGVIERTIPEHWQRMREVCNPTQPNLN
jgi:hypothetical protein